MMIARHDVRTPAPALSRSVRRHWLKATAVGVVILAGAIAAAELLPPRYASEAKLFVRLGRESVAVDPTVTAGQAISLNDTRQAEINSILDMLRSRALLEQVVDRITPAAIIDRQRATPELTREAAVETLRKTIQVEPPRQSSVITVHFEGRSPELAAGIGRRFLDVYLEQHVRANQTSGSLEFFNREAEAAQRRLDDATRGLRDAKNEAGVISLDSQRQALQTQVSLAHTQVLAAEAALAGTKVKVAQLQGQVEGMPARLLDESVSGVGNAATDGMKQKLFELQAKEAELATKMNDNHPVLAALRQQVARMEQVLADEPADRTQSTQKINRARESLETSVRGEEATLGAQRRQLEVLTAQREQSLAQLRKLNQDEVRLAALERDLQRARGEYESANQRREQARVLAALDAQKISNVNVVQPPTPIYKAVSPNKPMWWALGGVGGLFAALAVVLLCEFFDETVHSPEEAERQLEVPVLASLPRVSARDALLTTPSLAEAGSPTSKPR